MKKICLFESSGAEIEASQRLWTKHAKSQRMEKLISHTTRTFTELIGLCIPELLDLTSSSSSFDPSVLYVAVLYVANRSSCGDWCAQLTSLDSVWTSRAWRHKAKGGIRLCSGSGSSDWWYYNCTDLKLLTSEKYILED